jgi:hypothetical protein
MAIRIAGLEIDTKILGTGAAITALYQVQQALTNTAQSAFQAYTQYELLSKSMESLVAREKVKADSTLAMKDALAMSSTEAEKLLVLRELFPDDSDHALTMQSGESLYTNVSTAVTGSGAVYILAFGGDF